MTQLRGWFESVMSRYQHHTARQNALRSARRRRMGRFALAERLEERTLLTASAVVDMALANDTGMPGDNRTSDATLTVTVSGAAYPYDLLVEFDFDGDGFGDDMVSAPDTTFEYDANNKLSYDWVTVYARALEYEPETFAYSAGAWASFNFIYEPSNLAPVITYFGIERTGENTWLITIQVEDESPMGVVVRLGGVLDGQGMTLDGSGFAQQEFTIMEDGHVSAQAEDEEGLWSDEVWDFIVY